MIQLFGVHKMAELTAKEWLEAAKRSETGSAPGSDDMARFLRQQAEQLALLPIMLSKAWVYDMLFALAAGLAIGAGVSAIIALTML